MDDLQKRMRETLKGIVAEHELEAVLDSELTRAHESLKEECSRAAREYLHEETRKYIERWIVSEESKLAVAELGNQLIENEKASWLAGGNDGGDSYRLRQVKEKIAKRFDEQVNSIIQQKIGYGGEYREQIDKADEAMEKYFSRAAALALEGLAIRALRSNLMTAEISMGLSEGISCGDGNNWGCQGKVVPGKCCPECGMRK